MEIMILVGLVGCDRKAKKLVLSCDVDANTEQS